MNKNLFTLLATFCFVASLSAQSKEKIVDKMAQHTCECINSKGIEMTIENKTKIEMDFGLCLIEAYNKNKKEANKYFDFSIADEQSIEVIAENVGLQMVSYCPDVFTIFIEEELEKEESSNIQVINGEFVSLKSGEFNTIIIKDSKTNREHKLLWLAYFEGSDVFENIKELKRKKLIVEYEEIELYDPKIKEYRNFKVISTLEIAN